MNPSSHPRILCPPGWSQTEGTLKGELHVTGTGLHTGCKTSVRLLPRSGNAPDRGILFRRKGCKTSGVHVGTARKLWIDQPLCSTLQANDGTRYRTVEHLLAALQFCEIDHAVVEMDAGEVPILDGSAKEWVQAIESCGREALPHPKRFRRLCEPVEYRFGTKSRYCVEPHDSFHITLSMKERGFGPITWQGAMTPAVFTGEIAPARSYGRVIDGLAGLVLGYLTGIPLLRGARLSSVAAVWNRRVIGGERFPDEFARHRILDICGDFSSAGAPVLGRFHIEQPSHRRNLKFIRYISWQAAAWEWVYAK